MAGSRVLLSTAAFFARPLAATFELAAECGYTGVEVMVTKDPASQSASGFAPPSQIKRVEPSGDQPSDSAA